MSMVDQSPKLIAVPLTPARARLLDLLRSIHFGRLEQLRVRDGEPVFSPPPRVVKRVKFGPGQAPARATPPASAHKKQQARDLLDLIDLLYTGTIDVIEVADGLPYLVEYAVAIPGA